MKIPALFLTLSLVAPLSCAQESPQMAPLAQIQNPQITELSGLAASRRYPGLLYAHNDSGDTARIFLLNQKAETVATIRLKGAYARDWEDIALSGQDVYVADIGDNIGNRDAVQIYRFAEPDLDPQKLDQSVEVKPQVGAFRFPAAPRDAETLLVAPGGQIVILSKSKDGSSLFTAVFKNKKTRNLQLIADKIKFGQVGIFTKLATGGDISPDGSKLVVTTYAQIYEWHLLKPFGVDDLKLQLDLPEWKPVIRDLPGLKQCESACYSVDGKQIFVSSEGKLAPIYALPSAF